MLPRQSDGSHCFFQILCKVQLVIREVEKLNALQGEFKAYRRENPKGLTRSGIFYWLDRYLFGGTPGSGPTIPSVEAELVQDESKYGHS